MYTDACSVLYWGLSQAAAEEMHIGRQEEVSEQIHDIKYKLLQMEITTVTIATVVALQRGVWI